MPNPIQPDQATVDAVVVWLRLRHATASRQARTLAKGFGSEFAGACAAAYDSAADAIERGEPFR
jgi:hypothetical protein